MMVCGTGGGSISSTEGIRDVILPPTQVIIEKLAEQIEFSHLAQSLRDRINVITDLQNGLTNVNSLVVSETSLLAQELLALKNDLTGAVAYINEQTQVSIGQRESMVNSINTLMAQYGTSIAALEEQSTVLAEASGALMAEKTIKTDLAGNVSGYGLSAYVDPQGNATSDFQVRADTFSIAPPAVYSATPPAGGFNGKVWIDTSAGNTPKWYNSTTGTWQTTPVKGAVPFIVKTTAETIDGIVFPAGVYIDSAYITKLTADKIDTRGLEIKDANGNVIFAAGTALDWGRITGSGKPADGATRNIFRDSWVSGVAYSVGDIVMDALGYGWTCQANHVSSSLIKTPTYPTKTNAYWALYLVKGDTGSAGSRGSVTRYGSGSWSDAAAASLVPGSSPVIGDTVTFSTTTSATTKYWTGAAWVNPGVVIDGNLLVRGTLTAGTTTTSKAIIGYSGYYNGVNVAVSGGVAKINVSISGIGTPLWSWATVDIAGVGFSLQWWDNSTTVASFKLHAWNTVDGSAWTGTVAVLRIWIY